MYFRYQSTDLLNGWKKKQTSPNKLFQRHCKEQWSRKRKPSSPHVNTFMDVRQDIDHTYTKNWKEQHQEQLPYQRGQRPLTGSLQRGLNWGCNWISSKKAFKCPDTLSLTPLAPQTTPGWLSGFISWKNSLIKIQTVTVSPLLKGLKSVLC